MKLIINDKGIGLVETILAVGIAIIVITALVSLAVFTLRSSQQSKYLLEGSKLANQQLELVRAYRETVTWTDFYTAARGCDVADCYITVNDSVVPAVFTVVSGQENLGVPAVSLVRYFRITQQDGTPLPDPPTSPPNVVRVSVTVAWKIGGNDRFAHTYTDLSNWQGN